MIAASTPPFLLQQANAFDMRQPPTSIACRIRYVPGDSRAVDACSGCIQSDHAQHVYTTSSNIAGLKLRAPTSFYPLTCPTTTLRSLAPSASMTTSSATARTAHRWVTTQRECVTL
eukprot:354551-Chlamydomonas_euryale.AAC.6